MRTFDVSTWALLFALALCGPASFAEAGDQCSTHRLVTANFSKLQCALSCQDYWQKHPSARPESDSDAYCESAGDSAGRLLQRATWDECGASLWTGLNSFASKARLYLALIGFAGHATHEHIEARKKFIEGCNRDEECRRTLARGLVENMGRDKTGQWLVSDAELDRQIAGQDVLGLAERLDRQQDSLKHACEGVVAEIAPTWANSSLDGGALALRRFQQIAARAPQCLGPLHLTPPTAQETPPAFKRLGIRLGCYDQKNVINMLCLQVGQMVADPLVVVPGATVAGMAARGSAAKLATAFFEQRLASAAGFDYAVADMGTFSPRALTTVSKPQLGAAKTLEFENVQPVLPGNTDPLSKNARSLNASGVNVYVKDFQGRDASYKAFQSKEYDPKQQRVIPYVAYRREMVDDPESAAGTFAHEGTHALNELRGEAGRLVGKARLISFDADSGEVFSGQGYSNHMRIDEVHARAVQSSTQVAVARRALSEGRAAAAKDQLDQAAEVIARGRQMKAESSDHLDRVSNAFNGSKTYAKKSGLVAIKIQSANGSRINVSIDVGRFLPDTEAYARAARYVERARKDLEDMDWILANNQQRLNQLKALLPE